MTDGRNRIHSMALRHQFLYEGQHFSHVNIKPYLKYLVESLMQNYNMDQHKIKVYLDINELYLKIDSVATMGLLANELLSHSLKHAFEGRDTGKIWITLKSYDKSHTVVLGAFGTHLFYFFQ